MFYEMSRTAWGTERETGDEPVPESYPLMLNRYGCETIYKDDSTVYLFGAFPGHDKPDTATQVADSWAALYQHLDASDADARDAIFRVYVEEQDEETGQMMRLKMTVARARAKGHKAKQGRTKGADFVRGDVGPPSLPDTAVEGIVSRPVLPMKGPWQDELEVQKALDEVTV